MAEYIEREDLIKRLELRVKSWSADCNSNADKMVLAYQEILHIVKNIPTADVVPKSEVKRVYYNLQAVLEERAETKQEIAREIFEELARKSTYVFPTMLYTIAKRDVDELEKKYLGGVKNAEKNTDL